MSEPTWPDALHGVLTAHEVRQVAYVPDAGHSRLIEMCEADPAMAMVSLTTEEEGIGVAAGAWLGGQRAALLMQSSGVGNCVNMLAMARVCRFPLLILVTMRGQWGEFNPWQVPMGQSCAAVLRLAGAVVYEADDADRLADSAEAAARSAFLGPGTAALLIGQQVVGAKTFGR